MNCLTCFSHYGKGVIIVEGFINRLLKLLSEYADVAELDAVFKVEYNDTTKVYTAELYTDNDGTYGGTGHEKGVNVPETKFFEPTFQTWFIYNLDHATSIPVTTNA